MDEAPVNEPTNPRPPPRLMLIVVLWCGILLLRYDFGQNCTLTIQLSSNVTKDGLSNNNTGTRNVRVALEIKSSRKTIIANQSSTRSPVAANCSSMYHRAGDTEHSPIVCSLPDHHDVVVCRTPKVGSTLLRIIAKSFQTNTSFKENLPNADVNDDTQLGYQEMSPDRFEHLISANTNVSRIMFVRHPVLRLLSTYGEEAAEEAFRMRENYNVSHHSAKAFAIFAKDYLPKDYFPDCGVDGHAMHMSMAPWRQHWAPPQHCRCGITDCNIEYEFLPLERIEAIQDILKRYVNPNNEQLAWLPNTKERVNKKDENDFRHKAKAYLTNEILAHLNRMTKTEQEFFGYLPLTLEQVADGTVGMVDDDDNLDQFS